MIYTNNLSRTQYRKSANHNYAEYRSDNGAWKLSASVSNDELDDIKRFKQDFNNG